MKKKILSGILVILVIISTIFMEVSAVVVNQSVQNINVIQNESTARNEVKRDGENRLAENVLNAVKENSTSEEVEHAQNSLDKAEENATKQETESEEKSVKDEENQVEEDEEKSESSEEEKDTIEKEEETIGSIEKEENPEGSETKEEGEGNPSIGEKEDYITEDDLIYSNKYLVKGKVIYRIDPKTSIEEFRKNIEIAEGQEIKIYKGEKEITSGNIGTGMKIKGTNGEEYETSVIGDITGDGIANQVELTMIIRHIINLKGWELEGIEKASADISRRRKNKLSRYNKTNKLYSIWNMGKGRNRDAKRTNNKSNKQKRRKPRLLYE